MKREAEGVMVWVDKALYRIKVEEENGAQVTGGHHPSSIYWIC